MKLKKKNEDLEEIRRINQMRPYASPKVRKALEELIMKIRKKIEQETFIEEDKPVVSPYDSE